MRIDKDILAALMLAVAGAVAIAAILTAVQGQSVPTPSPVPPVPVEQTESFWMTLPPCEDSDGQTSCLLFDEGVWQMFPAGSDHGNPTIVPTASVQTDNGVLRVHLKGVR